MFMSNIQARVLNEVQCIYSVSSREGNIYTGIRYNNHIKTGLPESVYITQLIEISCSRFLL